MERTAMVPILFDYSQYPRSKGYRPNLTLEEATKLLQLLRDGFQQLEGHAMSSIPPEEPPCIKCVDATGRRSRLRKLIDSINETKTNAKAKNMQKERQ
jgi:hypothetical protein